MFILAAACSDPQVYMKYQAGFRECADEVANYLGSIDGLSGEVHARLLGHLNVCMQRITSIAHISASSTQPSAALQGIYPLHPSTTSTVPAHHNALRHPLGAVQPLRVQIPQQMSAGSVLPTHGISAHHLQVPHQNPYSLPLPAQPVVTGIPPTPPPSSVDSHYPTQSPPSHTPLCSTSLLPSSSHDSDSYNYSFQDNFNSSSSPRHSRCSSADSLSATSSYSEDDSNMTSSLRNNQSAHHNRQQRHLPLSNKNINFNVKVEGKGPLGSKDMNMVCAKDMNMNILKGSNSKGGVKRPADDHEDQVFVKRERCEENSDDGDCWRPW